LVITGYSLIDYHGVFFNDYHGYSFIDYHGVFLNDYHGVFLIAVVHLLFRKLQMQYHKTHWGSSWSSIYPKWFH